MRHNPAAHAAGYIAPPWWTLALALLAVAIHVWPGAAAALQFEREAVGRGEVWRLVTAHFTHFDANHLGWDVAVFLVLGAMGERASRTRFAAALAFSALAITSVVWLAQPQFTSYRGLSGLDCALSGLFAGSLVRSSRRVARIVGALALAGLLAKSALELATGATVFAAGVTYATMPLAHLLGAAIGFLVSAIR